ncbi:hypothetical protein DPX16_5496 [Anabarilius grahami]|uniref:CxC3 like cysteine cluster domain-containing protein n=1 Tax=Anabarilius grahami TaxID=495550 RepID=A0A3N0Z347_ANAGA|nr:hypothetical protein DPX16_5496 [Anabarilius grahami]
MSTGSLEAALVLGDVFLDQIQIVVGVPCSVPLCPRVCFRLELVLRVFVLDYCFIVGFFTSALTPTDFTTIISLRPTEVPVSPLSCCLDSMAHGFFKPLSPTTAVKRHSEAIKFSEQGRYNLTLPSLETPCCGKTWAVGLSDLLKSGYWPASIHFETVYEAGLFRSFLDLKLFAPGLSRQAFLGMLDRGTEYNGRATGKGVCGSSQWTAAKESAKKSTSKIDEEGLEIAVCRHGGLLKGLNMFRGEIFAYPLFLQNTLSKENVSFFCSDVACKYWPYLKRVVGHCPELRPLLNMHPLLSVMHAKAHEWSCETTERLKVERESFESLQAELNVSEDDIQQWATGNGNLSTKKMVFDRFMMLSRLKEEEQIIVMEVKQHWQSLKEAECSLRDLSVQIQTNHSDFEVSEESANGLLCLLKRKLEDLQFLQNNARMLYRQCVLGQASDSILFDNISDEETEAVNYSSDETDSDED